MNGGGKIYNAWWMSLSLCEHCWCMTKTLPDGRCGKCHANKRRDQETGTNQSAGASVPQVERAETPERSNADEA